MRLIWLGGAKQNRPRRVLFCPPVFRAKSQKLFTQKLLDPKATPLASLTPRPNPNPPKATQLSCSGESFSQRALCCFHDASMCHMLLWELKAGIGSASIVVVHPKDGTRPKSYSTGRLTQKLLHWQPDPKATHIGERLLSEAPSHPQPDLTTPSDSMMMCVPSSSVPAAPPPMRQGQGTEKLLHWQVDPKATPLAG